MTFGKCTPEELLRLQDLLRKKMKAFSLSRLHGSVKNGIKHTIPTTGVPERGRVFRFSGAEKDHLKPILLKLIEDDVIEAVPQGDAFWRSMAFLVRKSDGSYRLVTDFRSLNRVTAVDSYSLPTINEMLDRLGGMKYFATLDLLMGFFQIPIDEKDRHKTGFFTSFGFYQYKRMTMGLSGAPASFARALLN